MRKIIVLLFGLIISFGFSQHQVNVDYTHADVEVEVDPVNQEIRGQVDYRFDILKPVDSIFLDAHQMVFEEVSLNDEPVQFNYNGNQLIIKRPWNPAKNHELSVQFNAKPKQSLYFRGWNNDASDEIWTQGQGKYTSHWLPSIDDMNDKIEFDLTISAPAGYTVIANGKYIGGEKKEDKQVWKFNMDLPMSSYLVAFAIGDYSKKTIYSENGIPIELYFRPADSARFEPTYRYTKDIFDFLETEIGMAYPWQNYKQVPIHDFLYAGMENTGATFFSDDFMIDEIAFNDLNYVNVNAHELAHQWFGNLVTETSGTHHWLHEGFASYYALLAEKKLFGDSYYYMKLFESAMQLEDQDLAGSSTSLLDPKSNSLTFYEKGAWALFMLRELVGDVAFRASIKENLKRYRFKNVSTEDFMEIVEQESEKDLEAFGDVWLRSDDFPIQRALDALSQISPYVNDYINIDCEVEQSRCIEHLAESQNEDVRIKIIEQRPDLITAGLLSDSWRVRQAIALNLQSIPENDRALYESLLDDPSYITREAALYKLWLNFKDRRNDYLDKTKTTYGTSDYNIRLLWIVLALNTPGYAGDYANDLITELNMYTGDAYNPSLRIRAFNYLIMMNLCQEACQSNLLKAENHYNWQLSKFARRELAKIKN